MPPKVKAHGGKGVAHRLQQIREGLASPSVYDDEQLQAEIDQLAVLIDAEKYVWICERLRCNGNPHPGCLHQHARQAQRPPEGHWFIWDLMAGRGFGKTRTGSETTREWAAGRPMTIGVVAKKDTLCRELCFEGPSGLLSVIPPELIAKGGYTKSPQLSLRLRNGSRFVGFSAETPDNIRGWSLDGGWVDEWASMRKTGQAVIDQLTFAMREAETPRIIITSTPQSVPHQRRIVERANKTPDGLIRLTKGHTSDNRANLSATALEIMYGEYGDTRMGRQELGGELLDDVDGAMWQRTWIDLNAVDAELDEQGRIKTGAGDIPQMVNIVVAIDPAVSVSETSDETGIVAAGRGIDGDDYVLADRSGKVVGVEAAVRAWQLWVELDADYLIYENNQGDEWVRQVLSDTWVAMQQDYGRTGLPANGDPPIRSVRAKRGKRLRAEPVAARYEAGHVHHVRTAGEGGTIVNSLGRLEDQQCEWVPGEGDSPDRVDAAVYAILHLRKDDGLAGNVSSPAGNTGGATRIQRP